MAGLRHSIRLAVFYAGFVASEGILTIPVLAAIGASNEFFLDLSECVRNFCSKNTQILRI